MKNIVIFAGTTEGRKLSDRLCEQAREHLVCVATEYGEQVLESHPCRQVRQGRMDAIEMQDFFQKEHTDIVVDATHPYASQVTDNIKAASQKAGITYLRLQRELETGEGDTLVFFQNHRECAAALQETEGNILLTTGTKDLDAYCQDVALKERLMVRVLPTVESITLCEAKGISGKQRIAMQGPFSAAMNEAMLREYHIGCMVTKQSGITGGFLEKVKAAERLQIPLYVVRPEKQEPGLSFAEVCRVLGIEDITTTDDTAAGTTVVGEKDAADEEYTTDAEHPTTLHITLLGAGMGTTATLTREAEDCIRRADLVFGFPRLLEGIETEGQKLPFYLAKDILPYVREAAESGQEKHLAVLFSGDSGCYSGCKKLYRAIRQDMTEHHWQGDLRILPGISSVSYLAAACGYSWEDAALISIHGRGDKERWQGEVKAAVRGNHKTFVLVSGKEDVLTLCNLLQPQDGNKQIFIGYHLSYEDEQIFAVTGEEIHVWCSRNQRLQKPVQSNRSLSELPEGLFTCLVVNDCPELKSVIPALADKEFCRGRVPMTKEEIRWLCLAKLHLPEDAICYDIGSGTGSIAVEMASLSPKIQVYAIEKKPEALELMEQNRRKFGLGNMEIMAGKAPDCLQELPTPSHAFIGGSDRQLQQILHVLQKKNPNMHVVISAVSLETLQEIRQVEEQFTVKDFSLIQVAITRTEAVGSYHMQQAQNPIWICSFSFAGEEAGDSQ